ncbi:MAG: hypothetical protein NZT61_04700 [Deltaproteobacteria bacterium]|nr:hypothetical protein [Deltaproteobacteria bacterium]
MSLSIFFVLNEFYSPGSVIVFFIFVTFISPLFVINDKNSLIDKTENLLNLNYELHSLSTLASNNWRYQFITQNSKIELRWYHVIKLFRPQLTILAFLVILFLTLRNPEVILKTLIFETDLILSETSNPALLEFRDKVLKDLKALKQSPVNNNDQDLKMDKMNETENKDNSNQTSVGSSTVDKSSSLNGNANGTNALNGTSGNNSSKTGVQSNSSSLLGDLRKEFESIKKDLQSSSGTGQTQKSGLQEKGDRQNNKNRRNGNLQDSGKDSEKGSADTAKGAKSEPPEETDPGKSKDQGSNFSEHKGAAKADSQEGKVNFKKVDPINLKAEAYEDGASTEEMTMETLQNNNSNEINFQPPNRYKKFFEK